MMSETSRLVLGDKVFAVNRGDIEVKERIGGRINGAVFSVVHKPTGTKMAAKIMAELKEAEERVRELKLMNIMCSHSCPYLVNCYGFAVWSRGDYENEVCVLMEPMTSLDTLLWKLAGPIPEEIVCKMAVSIVKGLDFLKSKHDITHGNVRLSNMLLDREGNLKLCDFGLTRRPLAGAICLTSRESDALYMAPEGIMQRSDDVRSDVWAMGISLSHLATRRLAYHGEECLSEFEVLSQILHGPPPLPSKDNFTQEFYSFLSLCLKKDMQDRPYYSELLEHPLIKNYEAKVVDVGAWLRSTENTGKQGLQL